MAALALALLPVGGCFWRGEKAEPAFSVHTPAATSTNLVLTPARSPVARVASANLQSRIVVVNFPVGQLPALDTRMAIFRAGQKVGEVKLSGPKEDTLIVGDLVAGTAQQNDEVRVE